VLDLGANYGQFTAAMSRRFGCRVIAVEPAPEPYAAIPTGPGVSKIQAALAGESGKMLFHVSADSVASSLLRNKQSGGKEISVNVLSLSDLLARVGCHYIDLVKIDIEGAEIGLLNSCSDEILQRIGQITVEFHDFCGITPISDVETTLTRLRRIGFCSVRMSRVGHQDTWLINRNRCDISSAELHFTQLWLRNWMGGKRVARRYFSPRQ
jgi:FkbM family methyltransferase